jgi:tetratricopeptide (TPR) repeat protein
MQYQKGTALVEQGKLREAEPILNDAVKLGRLELDPTSAEFQRWLNSLGIVHVFLENFNEARKVLEEAVAIARMSDSSAKRPETVLSLSYLATLNDRTNHHVKAELLAEEAIKLAEANFGSNDPRLALPLSTLAVIYSGQARCKEAGPLIERALLAIERGDEAYRVERGKRHAAKMFYLYKCRFIHPGARILMEVELVQVEKYLPSDHPILASALSWLAQIYYDERQLEKAEASLVRAKSAVEASLGPESGLMYSIRKQQNDVYFERAYAAIRMASANASPSADDQGCSPIIHAALNKLNATKRFQLSSRHTKWSGLSEQIVLEWKRYWRWQNGPWSVRTREPQPIPGVSGCRSVGEEVLDGTSTNVFLYERHLPQSRWRVLMWVSKDTGLPIQSLLRTIEPDNSEEVMNTFLYNQNIGEPAFDTKR